MWPCSFLKGSCADGHGRDGLVDAVVIIVEVDSSAPVVVGAIVLSTAAVLVNIETASVGAAVVINVDAVSVAVAVVSVTGFFTYHIHARSSLNGIWSFSW